MPKLGILHDYDLWANKEDSAQGNRCAICGASPMSFQWSDYSGEAMCTQCGCPYQLKWGSDRQRSEDNYPYLNLNDAFVPAAKEYWQEKKAFVCYGAMMGPTPGMPDLLDWLKENHPEHIKEEDTK